MSTNQKIIHKVIKQNRITDQSINIGDIVNIIDGSGLVDKENNNNYVIISSYPKKTGLNEKLRNIKAEVVQTNVIGIESPETKLSKTKSFTYLPDIKIKLGDLELYTCSAFVRKLK